MKKAVIIALVILVALLAGPRAIDWNGLKPALAARVESALGRRMEISGPLTLSLLPLPALTAADVTLANLDGGDPRPMAHLPLVEMRLSLPALLGGRAALSSLRLKSPDIHLQSLADGRDNWRFGSAARPSANGGAVPAAAAGGGFVVDHLIIEEGRLSYSRPKGVPLAVDGVTGELRLSGPGGNWRAGGTALVGRRAVLFSLTGSVAADGSIPLELSLGVAGEPGQFSIGGQLSAEGPSRRFSGRLSGKAPALNALLPGLPPGALDLRGTVTATAGTLDVKDLTLSIGDSQATGTLQASFADRPAVDLALSLPRLDLDAWLGKAPGATKSAQAADTGALGAAGLPNLPTMAALPDWLSASLALKAEIVDWRGGRLRGLKLDAALANGEITIEQAKVQLPGQSDAALFGFLTVDGERPLFDGSFELNSDDLRGFLGWLRVDVSAVPADRLHGARLAGKIRTSPSAVEIGEATLQLDGARLDAAADLKLGPRPALGLSVSVDQVNIDAYRPRKEPVAAVAAATADARPRQEAGRPWYDGFDVNLKAHAGRLAVGGQTVDGVAVDAGWLNGVLYLHDLSVANLAGASLGLAGELSGLDGARPTVRGLHYEFRAAQPAPLFRLLGLPLAGERWKGLAIAGIADGGFDKLTVSARGEAGGALISANGSVSDPTGRPGFDLAVEVSHSSLGEFVGMLAPGAGLRMPAGGAAFSGRVIGDWAALGVSDLRLRAGPLAAAGGARLSLAGRPRIELDLHTGELPLQAFLAPSRPVSAVQRAEAAVPDRVRAIVPEQAAPRPAVRTSALTAHWSAEMLDLSWLKRFDGELKLDARAILWGNWRFDAARLTLGLADGSATLADLSAELWRGRLTGKGRVTADGGIDVDAELHDIDMRNALLAVAGLQIAEGAGNAQMHLGSSGLSVAEWIGRLSGSGRLVVSDGSIRGFDLKAADERLRNPDTGGGLLGLLQSGLTGGATRIRQLSGDLRVKNGILSCDNLAVEADGGTAKGAVEINLPAYVMDAHADFRMAGAPGAPPLVLRVFGPLEAPRRVLDINQVESWLVGQGLAKGRTAKDLLKSLLPSKAPADH
ncbi:MAG TPA: AsmA family protein [Rhodospirillaceae bacterium]|nr:AsmA family protein [Rhodospirillaceae bacterium]